MTRIEPLMPPYKPELQSAFDQTMKGTQPLPLFRVIAKSEPSKDLCER